MTRNVRINTLYEFMKAVYENPGVNMNKIYFSTGLLHPTVSNLTKLLKTVYYLKTYKSDGRSTNYTLTQKGVRFYSYLKEIVEHVEG